MYEDFPRFEFEQVFLSDAADILAAREKARIMHHGRDIRAAGDEVELAFRKVLRRKLPASYHVGHGHIVDQHLNTGSQLDVVIADNHGTPILFQAENGSEYFPYEGVYAIGEVKSFYEKSKRYIHQFAEQLTKIRTQLDREMPEPHYVLRRSNMPTYSPVDEITPFSFMTPMLDSIYGNPLFSFMFFADAGDFRLEDVIDLYQTQPADKLPNIVCLLNRGVIVNAVTHFEEDKRHNWGPLQSMLQPGMINLIPARNILHEDVRHQWVLLEYGATDQQLAAHFSTLYSMLATHLRECRLTAPNLVAYVEQLFDQPTSTPIA